MGKAMRVVIRQTETGPNAKSAIVGRFSAKQGDLHQQIAEWLMETYLPVLEHLARCTGKSPRWHADQYAHRLIAGRWAQIGWLTQRDRIYTLETEGQLAGWIEGACIMYDLENDVWYYPLFLVAEMK